MPNWRMYLSFLVVRGGQYHGSENFLVGFLEKCLKAGQAIDRKFKFAIPPSLLFLEWNFEAILEHKLNLKREEAHWGWSGQWWETRDSRWLWDSPWLPVWLPYISLTGGIDIFFFFFKVIYLNLHNKQPNLLLKQSFHPIHSKPIHYLHLRVYVKDCFQRDLAT